MSQVWDFLATHWFAGVLVVLALLPGGLLLVLRQQRGNWPLGLLLLTALLGLAGVGGFLLPPWLGLIVALAALGVLLAMFLVLLLTGAWWAPLAAVAAAAIVLGLGGLVETATGAWLVEAFKLLRGVEFLRPWWLLLLGLVPLLILFSLRHVRWYLLLLFLVQYGAGAAVLVWLQGRFTWVGPLAFVVLAVSAVASLFRLTKPRNSLAGLGPVRQWLALGLRCALITFLALALAEPRIRQQTETTTVLFVLDRSLSVPEERQDKLRDFINDAVEHRGAGHERDKAGLIVFGRRPRLELPPSDAPRFNFTEVSGNLDGNYSDIAAALKLALASFPENTGKRIVLISDGNENLGNAEEQARIARQNGVQIDVVPVGAGVRRENEVLVERIEAPAQVEQGSRLPIRVLLRSTNPNVVVGTLTVKQISRGEAEHVPGSPRKNTVLQPGLNTFTFRQGLTDEQRSYTYQAEFQPEYVANAQGDVLVQGLPGDRVQNNRATTHVVARGQRRILLIEPVEGEHKFLVEQLRAGGGMGATKYQIDTATPQKLPGDKGPLAAMLSEYDCVILANVPASDVAEGEVKGENLAGVITESQQEVIRNNTHDQGCGLIMIGGPNSFGAGGWQGTPVEQALPVDCEIKSFEVEGKGGLVLIMHASEMANGNMWQKRIAKLAINKLSPNDEVGVLYWDYQGGARWHIDLQVIGEQRERLLSMVDRLSPGDMPEFDTSLKAAYDKLTEEARGLATKHVIIISDGDPVQSDKQLLAAMRNKRVTVTTVGVATHGAPQDQALASIAKATGGRFYNVKSPNALPEIYSKETRLVRQSVLYERQFTPRLVYRDGPTQGLPEALPPLYGFVRTTAKTMPLVETPIVSPKIADQEFPLLSFWYYGLGKSAAFTSDARVIWDRDWAKWEKYAPFWEQVIDWSLRPVESKQMTMTTEYRDGKVHVTVSARDAKGRPIIDLNLKGRVMTPGNQIDEKGLKFEPTNSGVYEAEFKAEEAGSYFITAAAMGVQVQKDAAGNVKLDAQGKPIEREVMLDSTRAGVTVPYSPEFADLFSNTALLERLRALTDGKTYRDDDQELTAAAMGGDAFRAMPPRFHNLQPVWYWLVLLTGVLLLFDVAVRRLAIEPVAVVATARGLWDRLRGRRAQAEHVPEFIERLRSRKAQVGETLDRGRAGRRFEGEPTTAAPPAGADAPVAPLPPRPRPARLPGVAPQAEQEADAMSRLMKAKKRVWEERKKPEE
jgi:uncharacterized membrane protein